jgi:hypothetical protein
MVNQQLLDYIKQQSQQGVNKEQIKSSLLANGWLASDVEEAFNSSVSPSQSIAPNDLSSQSFSPQSSKGLNKTLLIVISIIGGILIIGGGAFAYFNYFQSPEKIVQKMTVKLTEIKSLEYSGEIKIEVNSGEIKVVNTGNLLGGGSNFSQPTQPASNKKASNFSINFNGVSDTHDLNNPKGSFSFNINTDALGALGQGNLAFGLEIRTIDKIVYVKLNNVPNLGFFDLSAVANQWIKIDTEALKKQFGLEKLEAQVKEAQKKQELSPEQIEKLKIAVQQAKIFKITEKLPSEKIEGVNTYHYKFIIDKEGIKNLFIEISKIVQDKTLTEKELADFDKSFEAIELPEGEIWIGKNDLLPYKISLSSIIKETDKSKTSGEVSFTLLFKNFNKPVQIEIPTPIKTLEEVLGGLFGGQMQGLQPNIKLPTQ